MKRRVLTGIAVILLAIGLLVSCGESKGNGGGGPTGGFGGTVPSSPAGIPSFPDDKGYTAASQAQVKEFYDEFMKQLQEAIDGFYEDLPLSGYNFKSVRKNKVYSDPLAAKSAKKRAAVFSIVTNNGQVEINDTLKKVLEEFNTDEKGNKVPLPPELTRIEGNVNMKATWKPAKDSYGYDIATYPMTLNGSISNFKVEANDYSLEEGYELLGIISGSASAGNVVLTSDTVMSGTLGGNVNYAFNIGIPSEKICVKGISDISVTSNLASQTVTVKMNIKLYGDSNNAYIDDTITVTATQDKATVTTKSGKLGKTIPLNLDL